MMWLLKVPPVLLEHVGGASHHGYAQPHQTLSRVQGPMMMMNMVMVVICQGLGSFKHRDFFPGHKNMYFHAVKSTAHPPFIGAVGHSTDCIVKQSYTFGPNDLASGHQTVTKWSPSCH